MQVPVKTGRLCTGAYLRYSPIAQPENGVFQRNNDSQTSSLPVGPGGVSTKPDPIVWRSPIAHHFDVATIPKQDAKVYLDNLHSYGPDSKPRIQPQLRTALPMRKKRPVVYMSNGGSPNLPSDSAFHPINRPAPIAKIRTERSGERHEAASFTSHSNMWYDANNSFYRDQPQVGSDRVGRGRWHVVDQGVVK